MPSKSWERKIAQVPTKFCFETKSHMYLLCIVSVRSWIGLILRIKFCRRFVVLVICFTCCTKPNFALWLRLICSIIKWFHVNTRSCCFIVNITLVQVISLYIKVSLCKYCLVYYVLVSWHDILTGVTKLNISNVKLCHNYRPPQTSNLPFIMIITFLVT